jgi:hypothetical protein
VTMWGIALLVIVSLLGVLPRGMLSFDLDRVVGLMVFAGACVVIVLKRRGRWRRSVLDAPALALLSAGLLAIAGRAIAGSEFLRESILQYGSLATMALLALTVFQFFSTWRTVSWMLRVFTVTAMIVALVSLVALLSGTRMLLLSGEEVRLVSGWGADNRLGGFYEQPNQFAAIMALAMPTAVMFQALATSHVRRAFWTCAAGVIMAGLLISQARSAIMGVGLGGFLLGLLLIRGKLLKSSSLVWGCVAVAFAAWLFIQTGLVGEFLARLSWSRQVEVAAIDPSQDRVQIWRSAFAVALSHPFGVAAEGSARIGSDLGVVERSAHNVFLSYLVAYGFLGAAAVVWLAWRQLVGLGFAALRAEGDAPRIISAGLLAALVGFWVHNLAHSIIQWMAVWLYFACAAAVIRLSRAPEAAGNSVPAST